MKTVLVTGAKSRHRPGIRPAVRGRGLVGDRLLPENPAMRRTSKAIDGGCGSRSLDVASGSPHRRP